MDYEKLKEVLIKKALGIESKDEAIEYVVDSESGEFKPVKKRVTKKSKEPDIAALKTLIELTQKENENEFDSLSDEQLENERIKILKEMREMEKNYQTSMFDNRDDTSGSI